MNPLILTLRLDKQNSQFFDRERARHFPPERNFLQAHITLFHHLPQEEAARVRTVLVEEAARQKPFAVGVEGLRFLGRGVAYRLISPELTALRADLAACWDAMLTAQDRQKFQPHVTVQNKAEPAAARALFERLSAGFAPWTAEGVSLELWEYRGGPWKPVEHFPFAA